jgi:CRP-like cAMP-binding protein
MTPDELEPLFGAIKDKLDFEPGVFLKLAAHLERSGLPGANAVELFRQALDAPPAFQIPEIVSLLKGFGFGMEVQPLMENGRIHVAVRPVKKLEPNSLRVQTSSAGIIQFRCPPNTVKTMKKAGEEISTVYVLTDKSIFEGVNYLDITFPVFEHFFLHKGRKTVFLCASQKLADRVKALVREEIFGPTPDELTAAEMDPEDVKDISAEMNYFLVKGADGIPLKLEDWVTVIPFIDNKVQVNDVTIEKDQGRDVFQVFEKGVPLCRADLQKWEDYKLNEDFGSEEPGRNTEFGVYFFDPSTGFDPDRLTSSFIIWIGEGRAIVVDPLAFLPKFLEKRRIDPYDIEFLYLTHTHSDHDDGIIEQVLNGRAVKVMTSRVILESFIRKVMAITDWKEEDARKLIQFVELAPGKPLMIHDDLQIDFDYAFHSVPTGRFVITYKGKKISYSADTLYDPDLVKKLVADGIVSQRRADTILGFIWGADLIVHDAGGGIHTSPDWLEKLPFDTREKVIAVHVHGIGAGTGLRQAGRGDETTLIPCDEVAKFKRVMKLIDRIPLFVTLSLKQKMEILENARHERFEPGAVMVKEGDRADRFFIVVSGEAEVLVQDKSRGFLSKGDYFGEIALLELKARTASIRAKTIVSVLSLDQVKFNTYKNQIYETFKSIISTRDIIRRTDLFKKLPRREIDSLAAVFLSREYKKGQYVIRRGQVGDEFYIVQKGLLEVSIPDASGKPKAINELGIEDFFGEIALVENVPRTADVMVASDTAVLFYIKKTAFDELTRVYPGMNIRLKAVIEERKENK